MNDEQKKEEAHLAKEFARFKKVTVLMHRQQIIKKYGLAADDGRLVSMTADWLQTVTPDDPLFGMWLAARHDAKPVMDVYQRGTHCGTAWTYANAWGGKMFNCKEAAIEDALQAGFRFKGAAD